MSNPSNAAFESFSIAVVERDTGLSKDTLRIWERRYGFPAPLRDAHGERIYPAHQVEKLRLLRRLIDNGHRPGKVVPRPMTELVEMQDELTARQYDAPATPESDVVLTHFIDLIRRHQTEMLRQEMSMTLMRIGLRQFVIEVASPLSRAVGEAWASGQLEIFEEHLFTEQMSDLLRQAISSMTRATDIHESGVIRPRVLLTTFPQESHALGLLMAEALLTLSGCMCISLGVQMPLQDIAAAAQAHRADIVALSFSSSINTAHALNGLISLDSRLLPNIEIWTGGSSACLSSRLLKGIARLHVIRRLDDIAAEVTAWRQRSLADQREQQ
ncbi:MerR HTH family regulatory protein [Noviherbaspirillum humi]|uniref:MerR HTH family regulatory protein n=1 Tax=Noviherbaspirillum humi TaxID=1688639 RepID=A0A239BX81_9BURK|nr:MerR family transcriptional regulator [Noviherbaspirillum humi]SNS11773.1 MerR HTH family regulatory protein [Noviherbaspirillum humi]